MAQRMQQIFVDRIRNMTRVLLVLLLVCAACSSDDDKSAAADGGSNNSGSGGASGGSGDAGSSGTGGGSVDSTTPLYGGLILTYVAATPATDDGPATPATTLIEGSLLDAESPTVSFTTTDSASGCDLLMPVNPFCDPSCGSSALCVADSQCKTYPTSQNAGPIHTTGLRSDDVAVTFVAGAYHLKAGTVLDYPPCKEGDTVSVATDAGAFPAFALSAKCIAPLSVPGPIAVETGKDLKVEWSKPAVSNAGRIQVQLEISHHGGGSKGRISCEVDDTGSLAIPWTLLNQLIALGTAGFPSIVVSRVATGQGTTEQTKHASLTLVSSVEQFIGIPGVESCAIDTDCTGGKTCDASDDLCK